MNLTQYYKLIFLKRIIWNADKKTDFLGLIHRFRISGVGQGICILNTSLDDPDAH